ncbi:MAG TPA: aminotransferase class I/II-fold pyridoxal phosphate-dependent enzyme [Desulfobacterales bacterium]|nr:aminotransferase class I/II-fold pyridoxal phosphate-dependent enzyme [Desulfobacterales bacterium]
MDIKEFRKLGYRFVDWVADYLENVGDLPVMAQVKPGEIRSKLPQEPPEKGEPMEALFEDFKRIILPGITHWQHPGWFAYFPANNSPPSILAELLTAGIGAQCMIWQTSPAAAELEEVVMEWLRKMLGLPEGMQGCIQDTASTSTLVALLSARERATNFESNEKGFHIPLTVYASEEAHSSIEKDVKIAGYGSNNLRYIPTDDSFAMIPSRLEEAIEKDKRNGLIPASVVATIGTTSSTAIDPLEDIGKICERHNVWLHVDAAFAGTAAILPEKRYILNGAQYMDSFVFNPHKWMLTNFDCSACFVRDPGALIRTFEIHPEYLKTGVDAKVKNFRDWGIQLGRRFRALKLWFVIRSYGVEGLREFVRKQIDMAQTFRQWVEEHEQFELMAPVPFSLVCFRYNDGRGEEELSQLNETLLNEVNGTGQVFLTHTTLRGKYTLRMAIGSRTTDEHHVRRAWELIANKAKAFAHN